MQLNFYNILHFNYTFFKTGGQDLEENNLIILNDEITSFSFDELNMCVRYLVQLNNRSVFDCCLNRTYIYISF